MRITLTDAAVAHVRARRAGRPPAENTRIRIAARAGRLRCRFHARPEATDTVVTDKGVLVAVAAGLAEELDGTILDVVETEAGARLALRRSRPRPARSSV